MAYDRWPRRWLFIPALFIGALSTVVYATTHGFWPLLVGRLLWGLAWSGIWVGGATMILDVTTPQNRGRWTGLYQTWFFMGAALGSFLGGLLTDTVGYTSTMWIGAALTALGGVVAWLLLPETRDARAPRETADPQENAPRLRANRGLWMVASMHGMNRFIMAGILTATLGLLVKDRLALLSTSIGVATFTGALSAGRTMLSMGAAPLAGATSDRVSSRWTVALLGIGIGIGSLILVAWERPEAILVGIAFSAVAAGSVQSLVTALIGDLVRRDQQGGAIGLVHTAGDIGSAAGPPIAYALLPWIGLSSVYLIGAGLFAVELALVWMEHARKRRMAVVGA